jgi:hypothetical protein
VEQEELMGVLLSMTQDQQNAIGEQIKELQRQNEQLNHTAITL